MQKKKFINLGVINIGTKPTDIKKFKFLSLNAQQNARMVNIFKI